MQFLQSFIDTTKIDTSKAIRCFATFLTTAFCALFLAGCVTTGSGERAAKAGAPPDAIKREKAAQQNAPKPPVQPIKPAPSAVDTLRALAPNTGLKTTRLFDEPLRNTGERVDRLENTVQQIKDDFDAVTPAVVRLVAIEKDIQGLIGQLETLMENDNAPSQMPQKFDLQRNTDNVQAPPKKMDIATAAMNTQPMALQPGTSEVKIEERADATRVSIPVKVKPNAKAVLSKDGRKLTITLDNTKWSGRSKWSSEFSPLVSAYTVTDSGQGSSFAVDLHFISKILKTDIVTAPNGQGYAFVVELQSEAIHFP